MTGWAVAAVWGFGLAWQYWKDGSLMFWIIFVGGFFALLNFVLEFRKR